MLNHLVRPYTSHNTFMLAMLTLLPVFGFTFKDKEHIFRFVTPPSFSYLQSHDGATLQIAIF